MSFATRADYREALRDHRPWYATTALYVGVLLLALVLAFTLARLFGPDHQGLALVVFLVIVIGLPIAWVWRDAAHRVAGMRIRRLSQPAEDAQREHRRPTPGADRGRPDGRTGRSRSC